MTEKNKTLLRVEDEFNIYRDGRKFDANGRKYVLKAVQDMIASERTQEGLRLRELFGYFGHTPRTLSGKLALAETDVIMVKGKPVVVQNVPSNVLVSIEADDSGNVRHVQEFLATDTGEIAAAMHQSQAGGWSWAVSGSDRPFASEPRRLFGFDYVYQPNFVSSERQQAMMESVGASTPDELIRHQLAAQGLAFEECDQIMESWASAHRLVEQNQQLETEVMMLEGYLEEQRQQASRKHDALRDELEQIRLEREQHQAMMLEALGSLPIMLSDQQKQALVAMRSDDDKTVLRMLFESLGSKELATLPLGGNQGGMLVKPGVRRYSDTADHMIDFARPVNPFRTHD